MAELHDFNIPASVGRRTADERDRQTHWIDYDAPVMRGRAQASCGGLVPVSQFSPHPTCPGCRRQQAVFETFEF